MPASTQHSYVHLIIHPPCTEEYHNYLDVDPGLKPRTTIQLQWNVLRPHVIHYADYTMLLLPRPLLLPPTLPSILRRNLSESHHAHAFLFVSVNPEAEMPTQEEMQTQEEKKRRAMLV